MGQLAQTATQHNRNFGLMNAPRKDGLARVFHERFAIAILSKHLASFVQIGFLGSGGIGWLRFQPECGHANPIHGVETLEIYAHFPA
jgi:hypothetical protein